jgi:hypothetical protein
MAFRLTCPCGEQLQGRREEDLVAAATAHLEAAHQRHYSSEEIMFMAISVPDE